MDKNPEVLKQSAQIDLYRAEVTKASRQIQGVANFFSNANTVLAEQILRLDAYQYPTPRLQKIADAITIIQRKLLEEASAIEQKSKFPPQN